MRKLSFLAAAGVALTLTLAGCSSATDEMAAKPAPAASQEQSGEASDPSADTMGASRSGAFAGQGEKSVEGTVTVTADKLTLSDFSASEGPDLHVYLTDGDDAAAVAAGMEIDLVASDQAEQTFTLEAAEAEDYTHVVIYCDKAKVVFGAAELM